jgi:hypothetical protein
VPDQRLGEVPCAYVTLKMSASGKVQKAKLREHALRELKVR